MGIEVFVRTSVLFPFQGSNVLVITRATELLAGKLASQSASHNYTNKLYIDSIVTLFVFGDSHDHGLCFNDRLHSHFG